MKSKSSRAGRNTKKMRGMGKEGKKDGMKSKGDSKKKMKGY